MNSLELDSIGSSDIFFEAIYFGLANMPARVTSFSSGTKAAFASGDAVRLSLVKRGQLLFH
jgi:hypothetical protein